MKRRVTSVQYRQPHRPTAVRLANALGQRLAGWGMQTPLTPEKLLAAASRRNGGQPFGDTRFVAGLERLLLAVEGEAALHPVGRWITRERLIGVLGNRLRAEALWRQHPEIDALTLAPPIVITGLQRTGTTLLHRLLAADPDNRSLQAWEALNPAPLRPSRLAGRADRRVLLARVSQHSLAYFAPDFFAVHPVEATAPEEDCILMDFSFLSPVAEATLRVPSYSRWLQDQDMGPAYRYMARLLRLLQWQKARSRWVLKTPAHMEYLEALVDVFPEAVIVQTHRDPIQTLPSFCSMIAHGRGVFSDGVDPHEIGRDWLRRQSQMVAAAARSRRAGAIHRRVVDLSYRELVRDPIAQVERIYGVAGMTLTRVAREAMRGCLKHNVQHRHGKHRYRLSDFGLTRADVERAFAPYYQEHAGWLAPAPPPLQGQGRP